MISVSVIATFGNGNPQQFMKYDKVLLLGDEK